MYEDLFVKLTRQEEIAYDKREDRGRNKFDFVIPPRFGAYSYITHLLPHINLFLFSLPTDSLRIYLDDTIELSDRCHDGATIHWHCVLTLRIAH